jgi:outer membrane protein OmpA-like peptidoglycan-associated protein
MTCLDSLHRNLVAAFALCNFLVLPLGAATRPLAAGAPSQDEIPSLPPLPSHPDAGFFILYEPGSGVVPTWAHPLLDNVAAVYALRRRETWLKIQGSAGHEGSAKFNRRLSCKRAQKLREELVRRGVPRGRIVIESLGESAQTAPTDEGAEQNNRSALILFSREPWAARPGTC